MKTSRVRFFNHYYNRLMLINTAIVCMATVLYGLIATRTAFTYEKVNQLKPYEYVLNQLHIHFLNKQENYANLMFTLYEDNERFRALSALLDSPSSDLSGVGAFELQDITRLLLSLCNKDEDIHSIYIYKAATQTMYAYSPTNNILQQVQRRLQLFDTLAAKDYPRTIYGAQTIPVFSGAAGNAIVYGIGGNLSTGSSSVLRKPGSILVAYDTNGLLHHLQNADLQFGGRFLILRQDGEMIFDSERDNLRASEPVRYAQTAELLAGKPVVNLDGTDFYLSTLRDDKRGYLTAFLVPKEAVDSGSNRFVLLIVIGSVIFLSLALFVYFLATRFSTSRLTLLENAMTQIGSNNLSYRIPVTAAKDEFTAIAQRFNDMCDELQENIETAYVYLLRQKSAELHALQASINPHFLYNTLEAIRGRLAQDGNTEAAEMIVLLSRLYRNQIKGRTFVTLREEIGQCNMYLELFALRHDNNLMTAVRIPNELMRFAIPKNTLQPILENYLVHGLRDEGNQVDITAVRTEDFIRITVTDNGHGIPARQLKILQLRLMRKDSTSESGIGLSNVHERLRIVYGDDCGIEIRQRENQPGTIVVITLRAMTVEALEMRMAEKVEKKEDAPDVSTVHTG